MPVTRFGKQIPSTLNDLLQLKKEQINEERDRRLSTLTVNVNGIEYDADADGRENLNGILTVSAAGGISWPIQWRGSDNIIRPLDENTAKLIASAIIVKIQEIYTKSWILKDSVLPTFTYTQLLEFNAKSNSNWQ